MGEDAGAEPWRSSGKEAAALKALLHGLAGLSWEHTHILCPWPSLPRHDLTPPHPLGPREEAIVSSHIREFRESQDAFPMSRQPRLYP